MKTNQNYPQYTFSGPINLIVGGQNVKGTNYYSDAQIANLSNETSTCNNFSDYPLAGIRFATGAIVDGHPIICGGWSEELPAHSECFRHSKDTNSWTLLTNMSTKRWYSASVPVNGKLLVLGGIGYGGIGYLATSEYVSPDGDASQPGPDLPGPRYGHCAVKLSNGQVMLLGGDLDKKSVIVFNPDTEIFDQSLPPLTFKRSDAGCAVFKSPRHDNREVVLAVGGLFEATAEVLDYTQPNPAWTESNHSFIHCFI